MENGRSLSYSLRCQFAAGIARVGCRGEVSMQGSSLMWQHSTAGP